MGQSVYSDQYGDFWGELKPLAGRRVQDVLGDYTVYFRQLFVVLQEVVVAFQGV